MKCVVTGLAMNACEHCKDPDWIEVDDDLVEYETVGYAFRSQFKGNCTVDYRHTIRKGDLVSRVQRADNPVILVTGVACKTCTIMLPKGKLR